MSGGTSAIQQRNTELVDILSTDFVRRNENTLAWGKAVGMHQMLPGLRGFWPMSSFDENRNAIDLSGQVRNLLGTGSIDYPQFCLSGLIPYAELDGTDYFSRGDEAGLDIIGTENYITPALRGLSIGGWFYVTSIAPGHNYGLIGKWNANVVDERSYILYWDDADDKPYFAISSLGTAASIVVVGGTAITANTWHHIIGRFDPSAEIAVFVDGVKATNAVGIPASIYSGTADFNIGAYNNGSTSLLHGGVSLCWLCGSMLPDRVIQALYQHTRTLYGV